MSTRAQRRERAQSRRKPDPIADRSAAAKAIYAEYELAYAAAHQKAMEGIHEVWVTCDREWAEAWETRCRKLGELEEREPARTPEEAEAAIIAAAKARGADRIVADLSGERFTTTVEGLGQYGPATLAEAERQAERQAEDGPRCGIGCPPGDCTCTEEDS